ncbi:uncharacterized protein l(3)05822 [Drosophila tropicalis]|uniref:uncharacterized protein l(3)05822 n=1 Tax=Drosophila tropicalis TaxID=46794 RepID=UPI0035ABC6C4
MTIPTRPAPAPPGSGSAAAAGANASLEQLRRQLQQQHLEQQQQHHHQQQQQQLTQKLTIKLPPPPKGGRPLQQQSATKKSFNNNYFDDNQTGSGSHITRKFPQARLYTPATNWDDDPFGGGNSNTSNGNGLGLKKMPPPRPPPPKVQVNGQRSNEAAASGGSGNRLIPNIFQRKKASNTSSATTAATKVAAQNRVYGLSSGQVAGNGAGGFTTTSSSSSSTNYDWNAAWNTATTSSSSTSGSNFVGSSMASTSSNSGSGVAEGQLISFDSPPSSPTFTQKSNSDCVSVDSFSSDSNFSSPNNGSVSQPESGFEDDYHHRSRPSTQSPLDPWEAVDSSGGNYGTIDSFGSAPVRQMQLQGRSSDNPLCNGKSLLPPTQSLQMPTIIKPKISQKPKAPKPPPFIGGMPGSYLVGGAGRAGESTPPSPPMPKGEPPKLPSTSAGMGAASGGICLLDVISGKVDALALSKGTLGYIEEEQIPYAIALYDFDGVEEGDLNFRENEKIYLLEQPTPEWLRGRTRAGCEGIFPANYVEIKVPLSSNSNQLGSPPTQSPISVQATARCLYQFPGEVDGDLSLQENDLVTVLYRINDDWLYGEIEGRQGQFPANFLEQIPPNLPTM